jgi:hypothetical protein
VTLTSSMTTSEGITQDLLVHLFKGYAMEFDKPFVCYIGHKKDASREGTLLTAKGLMEPTGNKYRILLERGDWNAPTAKEAKILALQVEVKRLNKDIANPDADRFLPEKYDSRKSCTRAGAAVELEP